MTRGVKSGEFFSEGEGTAESLVREALQNSLDARAKGADKVRVEFSIISVPYDSFRSDWLGNLELHLKSVGLKPDEAIDDQREVKCLVYEDFETTGLNGSLTHDDMQPYRSFWWTEGESPKRAEHGGRHGVGKCVFWGSSRMRFFLGLTVRDEDSKVIMTGQATLRPHGVGDDRFEPHGHFEMTPDSVMHTPYVGSCPEIKLFIDQFRLRRNGHPGLSIVVPFLDEDITPTALIDAIVDNAFHQICEGQLAVRVGDMEINRLTIESVAGKHGKGKGLAQAIALSRHVVRDRDSGLVPMTCTAACDQLVASMLDKAAVKSMRDAWAQQQRIGMRIILPIRHEKWSQRMGAVDGYMIRATDEAQASATYVRGRITVPFAGNKPGRDAVAMLVVREGPLSELLGDAEKPNHRDWIVTLAKQKGYKGADRVIKFCNTLLPQLYRIVNQIDEPTTIKGALRDVFGIRKGGSEVNTGKPPKGIAHSPAVCEVDRRDGGFVVRVPAKVAGRTSFTIKAGYAQRNGRIDWDPLDFEFTKSPIKIECKGQGECVAGPGAIEIREAGPGFCIAITGFDAHRDLSVVTEVEEI